MSILDDFKGIANWANGLQFGGWKPTKPMQYTFMFQNRYGHNSSLTLGFNTNFNNNFKFSVGFRF